MDAIRALYKVADKLKECRTILDDEMYHSGEVDAESKEFKLLRKIYDAICGVLDLM